MTQKQRGIPIRVNPAFWLSSSLIGFLMSGGKLEWVLIWMGIVFFSVMIHELGHAVAAKAFGESPEIELVFLGGMTSHRGFNLPYFKQFLIVAAGPTFGFLLALVAYLAVQAFPETDIAREIFTQVFKINIFWNAINLVPIIPLDGGQMTRIACEAIWGPNGARFSFLVSGCAALAIGLIVITQGQMLLSAVLFFLAWQSVTLWKQAKLFSEEDRKTELREKEVLAEEAYLRGDHRKAETLFREVYAQTTSGMIHTRCAEILANYAFERGEYPMVYTYLQPLGSALSPISRIYLHQAAFELGHVEEVVRVGDEVFRDAPETIRMDIAIRNAYAYGKTGGDELADKWIRTAIAYGLANARELVTCEPAFEHFRSSMHYKPLLAWLDIKEPKQA